MSLPFFYIDNLETNAANFTLSEDASKHIVQVLRMPIGDQLLLTNGKGLIIKAVITDDHKKKCVVRNLEATTIEAPTKKITIAISPLKNSSRYEWFLEKATEIGVTSVVPLLCSRTEKLHARMDRLKNILVSAMLQSQQAWLPEFPAPVEFKKYLDSMDKNQKLQKFIAYCGDEMTKANLRNIEREKESIVLIGPEGDFTPEEVQLSIKAGFLPVSLGETRLRTETAGIVAATLLAC